MSFVWQEYLELARDLLAPSPNAAQVEARLRCAISRAYYAAFCTARNHLSDRERHRIPRLRAHQYVRDRFLSSEPVRQRIGTKLDEWRIKRNKVDYDEVVLDDEGSPADLSKLAQDAVQDLHDVIQAIRRLASQADSG